MRCVPAHHFTVAKALAWRSAIDDRPPYQRESAVWSLEKQQLFIDSLLNGYDVPKIYLHDLRGEEPTRVYAIVDGKQRLTAIWTFLADEFALAADFRVETANLPDLPTGAVAPAGALRFSQLDRAWQRVLRDTYLSVVLIRNARPDDIEELFARLNNGEPLNAAERRNAMGGEMARLIREVAHRPFFGVRLGFSNDRQQHYDLAARLLVLEETGRQDGGRLPDLRGPALDTFVRANRHLAARDRAALLQGVDRRLAILDRVFGPTDPLLATPAQALIEAVFVAGHLDDGSTHVAIRRCRAFFEWFQRIRIAALDEPEASRDQALVTFSDLLQHGENDPDNLERRLTILGERYARFEREGVAGAADEPVAAGRLAGRSPAGGDE